MTTDNPEDRLLDAALEVTLGGQAGDDLTQRILDAAAKEQVKPGHNKLK